MDSVAGLHARVVAAVIDLAIVLVLLLLALLVAGVLDLFARGPTSPFGDEGGHEIRNRPLFVLARALLVVPVLGYYAYFRRTGQTPGMDWTGIRLVRADGQPPGLVRAVGRSGLTVVVAASAYLVWIEEFGAGAASSTKPYRELYTEPPEALVSAARIVLASWLLGTLLAVFDRRRRTLLDRLCGLEHREQGEATARDTRFDEWLRRR